MSQWERFPGPVWYRPAAVEPALAALRAASSCEEAIEAYHRVLFAGGNNHRGTLYPASVALAPIVAEVALSARGWPRWGAFEVLIELCSFVPEKGFETFHDQAGRTVELKRALIASIQSSREGLLAVLADPDEDDKIRCDLLRIFDAFSDASDAVTLVRAMPISGSEVFERARLQFLEWQGDDRC